MPFEEGILPIKYLGVPLISSRLLYKDCKILVEKVRKRIGDWKNKWLSFAGRRQLVISVLSSMHIYWASVFILPMGIINHIEQLMSGFLWCQGDMKRGKAKVSWEDVCLPKQEGGLGIRRLENFNVALMSTHVWKIVTRKDSLWVKWIHAYKLKKRSFLDVKMASNVSWGWRKLLQIRIWAWPSEWHKRYPTLNLINVPILNAQQVDKLQWKAYDGSLKDFSCREVWFMIQEHGSKTEWYYLVWSPYGIPRHAIHLWLVMKKRLKMKDRLTQWDVGNDVDLSLLRCPLCKSQQDSHEHLFFECAYSSSIWQNVLNVVGISGVSSQWDDIMLWLLPISKSKTVISIIGRLIVAATAYFLWRERNDRIHGKGNKKVEQVSKYVADSVRLKLASIKFKKNARVRKLMETWKLAFEANEN
ncbi:putative reverse transcriptase domain, reverse transcriptase zinc-binding domain protein [Tanacetum coccineum]